MKVKSDECHRYGMPLMILAYPRREKTINGIIADDNYDELINNSNDKYTQLVAHCVRIAYELGADIIKTQYTGSYTSFQNVVSSAPNKPVVIAGGKNMEIDVLLKIVDDAIKAGGAGVSIGRNVFNNEHSDIIISAIKRIVFDGFSASQAKKYYFDSISEL